MGFLGKKNRANKSSEEKEFKEKANKFMEAIDKVCKEYGFAIQPIITELGPKNRAVYVGDKKEKSGIILPNEPKIIVPRRI